MADAETAPLSARALRRAAESIAVVVLEVVGGKKSVVMKGWTGVWVLVVVTEGKGNATRPGLEAAGLLSNWPLDSILGIGKEKRMKNERIYQSLLQQSSVSTEGEKKKKIGRVASRLVRPKRERLFLSGTASATALPSVEKLRVARFCPVQVPWQKIPLGAPFLPACSLYSASEPPARYPLSATLQWVRSSKLRLSGWLASLPLPKFPYWAKRAATPRMGKYEDTQNNDIDLFYI
jgi:hypothetical protein